jgi:hypothetical protein
MTRRVTRNLMGSVALATVVTASSVGSAGTVLFCNGSPINWLPPVKISRNRCSIPDTGDIKSAYANGVQSWRDLTPLATEALARPADDCAWNNSDLVNEVFLSNMEGFEEAAGVTFARRGACFFNTPHIEEMDVAVQANLTFSNPSPVTMGSANANNGRGTFLHEMGHFFGLEHELSLAVMRPGDNGQGEIPLVGGAESFVPFPSDVSGIKVLYGVHAKPNMLASAMWLDPAIGNSMALLQTNSAFGCLGRTATFLFSIGNGGPVTASYGVRVRLSTSASAFGSGGTTVLNAAIGQGQLAISKFSLTFTIPTTLATGTYHVYVDLDSSGSVAELREGDNSTRSGRTVGFHEHGTPLFQEDSP